MGSTTVESPVHHATHPIPYIDHHHLNSPTLSQSLCDSPYLCRRRVDNNVYTSMQARAHTTSSCNPPVAVSPNRRFTAPAIPPVAKKKSVSLKKSASFSAAHSKPKKPSRFGQRLLQRTSSFASNRWQMISPVKTPPKPEAESAGTAPPAKFVVCRKRSQSLETHQEEPLLAPQETPQDLTLNLNDSTPFKRRTHRRRYSLSPVTLSKDGAFTFPDSNKTPKSTSLPRSKSASESALTAVLSSSDAAESVVLRNSFFTSESSRSSHQKQRDSTIHRRASVVVLSGMMAKCKAKLSKPFHKAHGTSSEHSIDDVSRKDRSSTFPYEFSPVDTQQDIKQRSHTLPSGMNMGDGIGKLFKISHNRLFDKKIRQVFALHIIVLAYRILQCNMPGCALLLWKMILGAQ